jgi:hypothetical protein
MRLIDADALFSKVESSLIDNPHTEGNIRANHNHEHQHFMTMVAKQPTVYDVGKVIEKLADKIDPNVDSETGESCNNWVVEMQNELIGECIDIVKEGVVKDE